MISPGNGAFKSIIVSCVFKELNPINENTISVKIFIIL